MTCIAACSPPREIRIASVSEKAVFYRRLARVGLSLFGFAGAAWMTFVAGSWILGRATPDRALRWFNSLNLLTPRATVFLLIVSMWLKAVYGFLPR